MPSDRSNAPESYRGAVLTHLTLLLVGVLRLAADVVGDLKLNDKPLLAEVFGFIEERYREPIVPQRRGAR
jgi:AraC family transcriptional regulator, transcriptional activator of pobA